MPTARLKGLLLHSSSIGLDGGPYPARKADRMKLVDLVFGPVSPAAVRGPGDDIKKP